ncbi:MAG TPA: hypothetical protein VKV05_12925 [Terriglobales bacterium]|nr:hypothetical protein [Terriglobales bacterium]
MKAHLLYRHRDFDWKWVLRAAAQRYAARNGRRPYRNEDINFDAHAALPWNTEALTLDLGLNTLLEAMGDGDDYIFEAARRVLLEGVKGDLNVIQYRQPILRDCLAQPAVVRELYAVAAAATEQNKGHYLGLLARYPDWVLRDAIERIGTFLAFLKDLRRIADLHADKFVSEGWSGLFAMLKRDLSDDYLTLVQGHLEELRFSKGELLSAELGQGNKGAGYLIHRAPAMAGKWLGWWNGLFEEKAPTYGFALHPRDEAGFRALAELRNQGIAAAASALGQAADQVSDFFSMLRAELAFYVGCLNLHQQLVAAGGSTCMPVAAAARERRLSFRGLYDGGLALRLNEPVVGNDADADMKDLVMITGPNNGGKSTFLRSVGLAQLMMQSGMFVAAESFCSSLCEGLFTLYKREEDPNMRSGKFDEELGRMNEIVEHLRPHSMILLNESFAATNEREGSEVAWQIVSALLEKSVRVIYVTHMYELAHRFYDKHAPNALFLRAARQAEGTRTFKLCEGKPLPTSFAEDVYNAIFAADGGGPPGEAEKVPESAP